MVHGLAAQLGGGFDLSAEPGEGTRVDLYLPVAAEDAPAHTRPAAEPMRMIGRRLKVLLVDDEEIVRTATAEMIRDLGHDVEEAAGGSEAIARLDAGLQLDVLVTDYMMPGMDGGLLARRVAKTHPELPLLLITGYTGRSDSVLHLPRLSKPFGQSEIAAALAGLFTAEGDDGTVVRFPSRKS
jgi:CheY-like chemotaxis protein